MRFYLKILGLWLCFLITGCAATTEHVAPVRPTVAHKGVYHKVQKGQTLWRIAKAYEVPINDIILSNNIPNVAKLEENQLIFIPRADRVREISVNSFDSSNDFVWPVKGKVLNYFREINGGAVNNGIDIQAQEGQSVQASRSGKVVLADYLAGYGHTVIVDHGDNYYSVYGQNAKLSVNLGDAVKQGEQVAVAGGGKDQSVHFEIRRKSAPDNPLFYLP